MFVLHIYVKLLQTAHEWQSVIRIKMEVSGCPETVQHSVNMQTDASMVALVAQLRDMLKRGFWASILSQKTTTIYYCFTVDKYSL